MGDVFAAILAGGSGTRMGNPDKPKQFWDLGGRPVLAHTVEKFCLVPDFRKVVVLCPAGWVNQTRDIVGRFLPDMAGRIAVAPGGATRSETVMAAVGWIEAQGALDADTILVTHDAVRPFVTVRMIRENIRAAREHGACDTVVPATDTIVVSRDGATVAEIPDRSEYYQGQTPQSFRALELRDLYGAMAGPERAALTDACRVFSLAGREVALVRGDEANIKLTYASDMRVARAMLGDADA